MIIFGLVALANFLLAMVLVPAHSQKEFLIIIALAAAGSFVILQIVYDKYCPKIGEKSDEVRPIFWNKLCEFQNKSRSQKIAIVFFSMILPLLISRLFDLYL